MYTHTVSYQFDNSYWQDNCYVSQTWRLETHSVGRKSSEIIKKMLQKKYPIEYFNTPTRPEPARYPTFFSIPDSNPPDIEKTLPVGP